MRRSEAIVLGEDCRVRRHRPDLAGHVVQSGPITTARRSAPACQGFEDVRKHRLSCNLMQNLWFRGFHPGSFPGGEDHGDAASFGGRQGGR